MNKNYHFKLPVSPSTIIDISEFSCSEATLDCAIDPWLGKSETKGRIFYTMCDQKKYPNFYELKTIFNENIRVNPKYIIKIENVQIVKRVTDITAWKFYSRPNIENYKVTRTEYIRLHPSDTWNFNDTNGTDDKTYNTIYSNDSWEK